MLEVLWMCSIFSQCAKLHFYTHVCCAANFVVFVWKKTKHTIAIFPCFTLLSVQFYMVLSFPSSLPFLRHFSLVVDILRCFFFEQKTSDKLFIPIQYQFKFCLFFDLRRNSAIVRQLEMLVYSWKDGRCTVFRKINWICSVCVSTKKSNNDATGKYTQTKKTRLQSMHAECDLNGGVIRSVYFRNLIPYISFPFWNHRFITQNHFIERKIEFCSVGAFATADISPKIQFFSHFDVFFANFIFVSGEIQLHAEKQRNKYKSKCDF